MRKLAITFLILAAIAGSLYAFREPLMEAMSEGITSDMFVATDNDAYDPGIAIGAALPPLLATYDGTEVTNLANFMGERGIALYAVRSVDW